MSLSALQVPSGRPTEIVGSSIVSNSPRERALEVVGEAVGVDRGEEADLAVVDGEHRDAGAGVAAQRGEDRAVAAEDDAEVDVVARARATISMNGAELDPVLGGLVGREAQRDAPRGGRSRSARATAPCVSAGRRWVTTAAALTMPRPPSTAPGRGRLGEPEERLAVAGRARERRGRAAHAPRRPAARAATRRRDDLAPQLGVAHDAALADPVRPTSNCGLTIARQSNVVGGAGQHGGQDLASAR